MIKVKDGYGKLIGSDYNGNIAHVLLSNGGNLQYAVGSTASTLVQRNASGQIESSVVSTVAPFVISSTKVNANLNADLLDGFQATGLFQSLTSAADKNLYIKIGDTEKEVPLLYASYLGGVTKEGLFTELTNVNDSTNPDSIKVTIGDTTKYLKVAYADLAGNANTLNGLDYNQYYIKGTDNKYSHGQTISSIKAINDDVNAWNSGTNTNLKLSSDNNAMVFTVSSTTNDRRAAIQVGHSATSYAQYVGILHLNPLGGDVITDTIQINKIKAPTTSGGTTYGLGTAGQVLKTNGTSVYWGDGGAGGGGYWANLPVSYTPDTSTSPSFANTHIKGIITLQQGEDSLYRTSINMENNYLYIQPRLENSGYNYNTIINPKGGNVGIGTLSPVYKLDVVGAIQSSDSVYGRAITAVGDSTVPYLPNINWFDQTRNVGFHVSYRLNETAKPLRFYYKNGDTFTSLVDITSTGNVGIGATSPIHKLQVAGAGVFNNTGSTTYASNGITIGAGDAAERYITCYGKTGLSYINIGYNAVANNSGELHFYYSSSGSTSNYVGLQLYGAANSMKMYPGYTRFIKNVQAPNYVSSAATGTQPYACTSTTLNTNLNADLLDGYHASSFFKSYGTYGSGNSYDSDWGQSVVTFDPVVSGTYPENNPNITILNLGNSYARRKQLACTYNNNNIYYRRRTDSSWSGWVRLAIAGESYTKSESDSRFINAAGDTMTGILYLGDSKHYLQYYTGGKYVELYNATASTGIGVWDTGEAKVFNSSGQYKIWHEGNDGTGSGLDADTVDGVHANNLSQIKYIGNTSDFCYDVILLCKRDVAHNARLDGLLFTTGGGVCRYHCADAHFWHSCWSVGSYDTQKSISNKGYDGYGFEFCTCTYGGAVWYAIKLNRIQAVSYFFMGDWDNINWTLITYYHTSQGVKNSEIYNSISNLTSTPLRYSGSIYAHHFYESSDSLLKTNIVDINSSDNIPQLKSFDWKSDGSHSYGLIAQELEEMGYPELVSNNGSYKTVNYSAALSLIVGKLQVKIKELEKEIEILKNKN